MGERVINPLIEINQSTNESFVDLFQNRFKFELVNLIGTGSSRGQSLSSDVGKLVLLDEAFFLQFIQNNFKSGVNVSPGTTVLMFFLNPTEFSIFIVLDGTSNILIREGSNLFNSNDSDIISLEFFSLSVDIPIDLTTANNDLLNILVSNELGSFRDNVLEEIISEFRNAGASGFVSEELLGGESDQRLSEFSVHLSTESMEIVGRE